MATREEIDDLKAQWKGDPVWDIEDTEGFQEHREELLAFHRECRAEWDEQAKERLRDLAAKWGLPQNLTFAQQVLILRMRYDELDARITKLESR